MKKDEADEVKKLNAPSFEDITEEPDIDLIKPEINEELSVELEHLSTNVFPNISDGSLLVITVGSDAAPADRQDMELVAKEVDEVFDDVLGVKALILPHLVTVDKIPLKSLRNIQSKVVNSCLVLEKASIDIDESISFFGDL
jgi:hypothetical protein